MDIRDVQSIRTELYDKTSKRDSITISGECIFDKVLKVLVVDDIADSGETLEVVMKIFANRYTDIEFKSATLFYKETSIYEPHYWLNKADDWINFFWDTDFIDKT
jgi:xanthine phosphoribosyltransferase